MQLVSKETPKNQTQVKTLWLIEILDGMLDINFNGELDALRVRFLKSIDIIYGVEA
jgi:hypothetical protein